MIIFSYLSKDITTYYYINQNKMKKFTYLLILTLFTLVSCQSTESKKTQTYDSSSTSYTVSIEEDSTRPFLPSLHSFVLGTSNENWLLLGGRTNGMHDFGGDHYEEKSFPHVDFNDSLFVCNSTRCYSMSVDFIPMPYRDMFKATNLQHLQVDDDLYITGGYGENEIPGSTVLEQYDTYPYMAKINLTSAVAAIKANDQAALISAISFGTDPAVQATGGELFKMGDYFYLAGGHIYKGIFSIQDSTASLGSQKYLDAVHRFKINDNNGSITITDFSKITDGYPDDSTQFRRRDLPVVPSLQKSSSGEFLPALTMYAGVFTSDSNKITGLISGANFTNPIYIHSDGSYAIDASYVQNENVYTCANFVMYDPSTQLLYTTLLGGIGDNTKNIGYTNNILSISRPLNGSPSIDHSLGEIPVDASFMGAEAIFIPNDLEMIEANSLIIDFSKLTTNRATLVGSFYGGIEAFNANPGGYGRSKSYASNKVYKVYVTKE